MRTRLLASAAAPVLAAPVLAVAAAAPASAEGCAVSSRLPDTWAITSSLMSVPVTVDDAAGCMDWVSYDLVRGDGAYSGGAVFDSAGTEQILFGSSDGAGQYTAVGGGGYDLDSDDLITVDSNVMDARFDSRFMLHLSRKSGTVTLELRAKRYGYEAFGYAPWSGARVHLQKRQGGTWIDVVTKTTNGTGIATVKSKAKKSSWRAVIEDSATAWGGETEGKRL